MIGREYVVVDSFAITAIADLLYVSAPTDAVVLIKNIKITQELLEVSEQLPVRLFRTTTNNDAVGTSNTPAPVEVGTPAFGGLCRVNITGAGLATETTPLERESQNLLNGWYFPGTFEDPIAVLSPVAGTAGRFVIKVATAPAGTTTVNVVVRIIEIGG